MTMAKTSAERKAAQRARQSAAGERKIELVLDEQEQEMLARNCAARRLVAIPTKWPSTSRCLSARMMPGCAAGLTPSANAAAASAAINFRWHPALALVILSAGPLLAGTKQNYRCDMSRQID